MRCLSLQFDSVQTLPNAAEAASLAGSVNLDYANHPGVSYTTTRVFHIKTPGWFTHKHPGISLSNTGYFTIKHRVFHPQTPGCLGVST